MRNTNTALGSLPETQGMAQELHRIGVCLGDNSFIRENDHTVSTETLPRPENWQPVQTKKWMIATFLETKKKPLNLSQYSAS